MLDAKSGFLQIKLDEESSYLTCFNTPFGRYRWLRLPFGLKCAPEIFQRIMDQMIEGIDGAVAIMDDILIAGPNVEVHDRILKQVIDRATNYNLKLNLQKCKIRQSSVQYVGHILSEDGLSPDPVKVEAVRSMPAPTDKESVRCFVGFITCLSKFIPRLSEELAPLRELLKSDVVYQWQPAQARAFERLKELCCHLPVLAYFDVNKPVEIHCDASRSGLGAVLVQEDRPIAYSSRALTETETRYAQIEKEMLSIVHAYKKFHCYIFGKTVTVYNDHKPLEIIAKKPLLSAPMRLQSMLLRLQWYDLNIRYRKGEDMQLPDTLSRAYLPDTGSEIDNLEHISMLDFLSVSDERYADLQRATELELSQLQSMILDGWPDARQGVSFNLRPYWDSRSELSVMDGILYKGMRIVVPPTLRPRMLNLIHESHLGIVKCKQRAREVLYWPSMNADIEQTVQNCSKCASYQNCLPAEPLKPTPTPDLPWSEIGTDLFQFDGKTYLITVDYYSKFIEVDEVKDLRCSTTLERLKAQFSRHGLPETLRHDNGTMYNSQLLKRFCRDHGICVRTSSPRYPRSNGEVERAVQTIKRLWRKCSDKHLALLDYRTTPLEGIHLSPAQLLMGRRPRNTLPTARSLLVPMAYDRVAVKRHFDLEKAKQRFYNDRHTHKDLPPLHPNDEVRMEPSLGSKRWIPAVIVKQHSEPRSYVVRSRDTGDTYRRNRRHLRKSTSVANEGANLYRPFIEADNATCEVSDGPSGLSNLKPPDTDAARSVELPEPDRAVTPPRPTVSPCVTRTRSGRISRRPDKLDL